MKTLKSYKAKVKRRRNERKHFERDKQSFLKVLRGEVA